ncbi:hypothetical protein SETIT_1G377700v2 [Setaria italica]|uniref:Uncharacterized protein n=1 Tax=Setaria italica TaxID=4555 RepID=A0A368PTJ4_SETIT|nr:hypothetical protein SETIT_1G377700v2 [Setaria italica]
MADHSLGFFSAVYSRLRAASSAWRRNDAPARDTQRSLEATVRSRLARRAGAARRFGRSLAFVSFNLEVLLFVYAFWRARRRNFNWRQPLQALPMLVIPALATLIYAAFLRFTRTLDLKDKKTLQRLHHQSGSGSHHHDQDSAKKCDPVDDASNFSSESDPAGTSKLGKHHRSSSNLRDDYGGDGSWDHSKDFQPMHSDGLRRRIFSIEKIHITNSSAFRQLINWSSEHLSDDPEDLNHMEGTAAEHRSNSGDDVAENGAACSTAQISSLLHGCSIAHIISNATNHADVSSSMSCPKSNGGLAEADAVQTVLTGPESDLSAIAGLHHEGVENESSKLHVSEDNRMPFISEKELLLSSNAVKNMEHHSGTSGFTLCGQETENEDTAGGFCFVKISPELSFLSSPELVVEGGKDASEKEPCQLDEKEENDVSANIEEALVGTPLVNTAEPDYGTTGFSLRPQDSNMMEAPAVINIFSAIPESNQPASVELLAENYVDSKDAQISDVHLPEQKGQEDFLDPLVVNSFEYSFVSEFLSEGASKHQNNAVASPYDGGDAENAISDSMSIQFIPEANIMEALQDVQETLPNPHHRSAAAEMTKVLGVVKEGLSEGASNHQNSIVASSDDGGDAEDVISDSVSVQLIPEANIMEVLQDVQKTLSDPPQRSSFRSQIFLSSSEINNDEAYSSNSNSYTLYANSVENEESPASKGGGSVSKDEMNFAFLDTPILLNEDTSGESWTDNAGCSRCIPESNRTHSLHDGKLALPRTSERANVGLEESLISLDQEINLEIFSLYSRSSSCVSEVNMTETLRSGILPALENDDDFSFDEMTSMMGPNVKHAENYTDNARSAEFVPEINMTETLNVGKEATARLEHEVSSNFDISLEAPDIGNGVEKFDNSLDLVLWPFEPVVDASEGMQAAQGFSMLQSENDFSFVKTNVTTKDVNNDGDLQNSQETSIDALGSAQPGLSKSEDEGVSTLRGTCKSPDAVGVIDSDNVLMANYASDLRSAVGNHFFSQNASPEAQPQDPLMFKESLVYPDELSVSENNSDNAKLLFCSTKVNLIESLDGDKRGTDQQQAETNLVSEDTYMACQGSTSEKYLDNFGYQHISDANITKTLQSTDRLLSEMFHDGSFCTAGTSVSLDGGTDADNSSANSGSEMRTAQNNTVILLGFQGPEKAIVSISQYEVDRAEKNGSDSICAEATMTGDIQGFLEERKVCEWRCTDKEPKDLKVKDMEEDVQGLDEDHESIGFLGGSDCTCSCTRAFCKALC